MGDRRSLWAWGLESEEPTEEDRQKVAASLSKRAGHPITPRPLPRVDDVVLRPPRISVPSALAGCCTTETWERAFHAYGSHLTDRTHAFNLEYPNPPDVVAHPADEAQLEATLDWCGSNGYVVVPYGGGSSVVWGVNPPEADAVVTVALDRLDQVLEIDETSRAARIQAGVLGPSLEDQLRPAGYTLRHFPQSFRFSSLGGWIATRSGGHYATNHTHIDDFVESVRMLTPQGWWESRRLPGSGAGPSPDRMVVGSEGILGIISEAWMRIQRRPTFRATAGVTFASWAAGSEGVREVVQAKLWPANLRLLDPEEAKRAAGLDGTQALMIIGFESAEVSQRAQHRRSGRAGAVGRRPGRRRGDPRGRRCGHTNRPRRRGRRVAGRLHRRRARRRDEPRPRRRHVRDGDHLGPLARVRCRRARARQRGVALPCSGTSRSCRAGSPTSTRTGRRRTTRGRGSARRGRRSRCGPR